jgi:hypothetical protein
MTNIDYPNRNSYQSWITDLQLIGTDAPSGPKIMRACLEIMEMLIKKNISYGNSALNPIKIFSKLDDIEGLNNRIDDKLTRVKNSQGYPGDNDIDDLIGYLVLLKIALTKVE